MIMNKKIASINYDGTDYKNEVNTTDFYQTEIVIENCIRVTKIVPRDFSFLASGTDSEYKYVAYKKNNSTFLAKVSESGTKIDELYIGDNVNINSIVLNDGLYLNGINEENNIIYEISLVMDGGINNIINDIVNSLINLIDKVSLSETSIASIILTEADKVKKVIETTSNIDKILEVNESILPVISEAVALEQYERSNLNDIMKLIEELLKNVSN